MRDHNYVDGFMRHYQMRPTGKYETKYGEVLLADSDGAISSDKLCCRAGFVLMRGVAEVGWYEDFPLHSTQADRLRKVRENAEIFMSQLNDTGYFDDERKQDFSTRPGN